MIKFIATDMDGTLLNSNNEIHADFYPMFQSLKEKDIIFAAASGRQYYNLRKQFEGYNQDLIYISENGSMVFDKSGLKKFHVPEERQSKFYALQQAWVRPAEKYIQKERYEKECVQSQAQ